MGYELRVERDAPLGYAELASVLSSDAGFELRGSAETAEVVAQRWKLTRDELDAFALRSHQRAVDAIKNGRFAAEIVPVPEADGIAEAPREVPPTVAPAPEAAEAGEAAEACPPQDGITAADEGSVPPVDEAAVPAPAPAG